MLVTQLIHDFFVINEQIQLLNHTFDNDLVLRMNIKKYLSFQMIAHNVMQMDQMLLRSLWFLKLFSVILFIWSKWKLFNPC